MTVWDRFLAIMVDECGVDKDEIKDGDPLLVDDLELDSWGLFLLYQRLVDESGCDDFDGPGEMGLHGIRVSELFAMYSEMVRDPLE